MRRRGSIYMASTLFSMTILCIESSLFESPPLLQSMEYTKTKRMRSSELLVSSPYKGVEHHLDLTSVSEMSRQLAIALQILQPVTNDYPSNPYSASFNWREIINLLSSDFSGILPSQNPLLT